MISAMVCGSREELIFLQDHQRFAFRRLCGDFGPSFAFTRLDIPGLGHLWH
jgi:hypothetical protein